MRVSVYLCFVVSIDRCRTLRFIYDCSYRVLGVFPHRTLISAHTSPDGYTSATIASLYSVHTIQYSPTYARGFYIL